MSGKRKFRYRRRRLRVSPKYLYVFIKPHKVTNLIMRHVPLQFSNQYLWSALSSNGSANYTARHSVPSVTSTVPHKMKTDTCSVSQLVAELRASLNCGLCRDIDVIVTVTSSVKWLSYSHTKNFMLCLESKQDIDNPEVPKFYLFAFRKSIDISIWYEIVLAALLCLPYKFT